MHQCLNVIIGLDLFSYNIYALYLYFLGLSLRNTSKAIKPFEERSYVATYGIVDTGIQSKKHFS
jgi:hypothetical protein